MQQVLKKISCALLFLLCFAAMPCLGQAATIAVITRNDIIPYTVFLQSYLQAGKSSQLPHEIKVFEADPKDPASDKDTARRIAVLNPDILVCIGRHAVAFRQHHFPDITMIHAMIFGPPGHDLERKAPALGLSMTVDPTQKISVLRKLDQSIRSIGAVYDPAQAGRDVEAAIRAAKQQGLSFDAVAVSSAREAVSAVEAVFSKADAFMLFFDKTVLTPQTIETIFTCSFRSRTPVIGLSEKYVNLGALFAIECDEKKLGQQAWHATETCSADPKTCSGLTTATDAGRLIFNKKIAAKMGIAIPETIIQKGRPVK